MKILITGANGFLGQHLTLFLAEKKYQVIACSRGECRIPENLSFEYFPIDLADEKAVEALVAKVSPDIVVHTAANSKPDDCHVNREGCIQQNVTATEYLLNALATQSNNPRFIYLSTDFIFDGEDGPYREEDQPNPVSFYGESKADAEKLVAASKCKWTIIRTVLVYGITANMSRSNIVLWVKSSLEKGTKINVVDDQWRTPTLAEDLAEGCLLVAEKEAEGIYHISGKDMLTVYDIAKQVAQFWNLDLSLISPISSASLNQEAKRPVKTGFVLDKAIANLNYNPHSLQEGLALMDMQIKGVSEK